MTIDAVDLFCGVGGLSYGMQQAGITVRAGIDLDPACEYAYSENIKKSAFILKDVSLLPSKDIAAYYRKKSLKLLAGCAPCQPFSTLRNGSDRKSSDKWPLLSQFARLTKSVMPDFVTMENVPVLRQQEVFEDFVRTLTKLGYKVSYSIVDAQKYGVPQRRKRLVLLASLHGHLELLSPESLGCHTKTVKDAIGRLRKVKAGQADPNDQLHKARSLSPINMERIKASRPGGTWQDWPKRLVAPCHKKEQGQSYKSVYARMEWNKPAPTITTQAYNFGTGRFGHPKQNRGITLREAAILQSFPQNYRFIPKGKVAEFSSLGRLIGNAVPVDLGYAIGMSIKEHAKTI